MKAKNEPMLPVTNDDMPGRMQMAMLKRECNISTANKACSKEECHRG